MQLYLIRHAQSVNNANEGNPNFKHVEDAPLTPLGHSQAAHLAAQFRRHLESEDLQLTLNQAAHMPIYRVDELHVSPFQRTLQTAKPLADALDVPTYVKMDIYEYGGIYRREGDRTFRTFRGLNREQMAELVPGINIPDDVTDEGWWTMDIYEPEEHFINRGKRVFNFLVAQAENAWAGKHIAMIAHADFINLLVQTILRKGEVERNPHRDSFMYAYNTSVTRIDFNKHGFPTLRYFSRVDHLPEEMVTL